MTTGRRGGYLPPGLRSSLPRPCDEAGREPFERREVEVASEFAGEAAQEVGDGTPVGEDLLVGSIVLPFPGPLSRPGHDPRFPWPGRTASRSRGPVFRVLRWSRRNDGAGRRAGEWPDGTDWGGVRETARQEALVRFAFSDVLRANEADDPAPMAHFRVRDGRYDARSLTLVKCRGGPEECGVHAGYPVPGSLLDYNRMVRRLLTTEHGPKEDISTALEGDISTAGTTFGLGEAVCPPFLGKCGGQTESDGPRRHRFCSHCRSQWAGASTGP